jgi:hypothetical protein
VDAIGDRLPRVIVRQTANGEHRQESIAQPPGGHIHHDGLRFLVGFREEGRASLTVVARDRGEVLLALVAAHPPTAARLELGPLEQSSASLGAIDGNRFHV